MLKFILKNLTFMGSLSIFLPVLAQAEFGGYQVLSAGEAKVIRSEAVAEKEGLLANLPLIGKQLEKKYGEKTTGEIEGTCNVSLMDSSVIVTLDRGPILNTYSGTKVFILTGHVGKHQSRKVTLTGAPGERILKGLNVTSANPNVRYNEYIRHPVERFCQNFIEQQPNVRSFHISVGNEIKQRLEMDEKSGQIVISEEGTCNVTTHKVALKCATSPSQTISDYLDYLEQKVTNE